MIIHILLVITLTQAQEQSTIDLTEFYKQWVDIDFQVSASYITIPSPTNTPTTDKLFYQLIYKSGSTQDTMQVDDPLIIWIQGGPGCSGAIGLYQELGPFQIIKDNIVTLREQSWNKKAHLLFIDQPFGSGFSYSNSKDIVQSTPQAAQYFLQFMIIFYQNNPQFANSPLYLFGESYSGHYIPAFTKTLLQSQEFQPYRANYKGVAIGDGLSNAFYQVGYYSQYLFSTGFIDQVQMEQSLQTQANVQQLILEKQYAQATVIQDNFIDSLASGPNIDPLNIQKRKSVFDYDSEFLLKYKKQMGVPENVKGTGCNQTIYNAFSADITQDYSSDVVYLLTQGPVLIFNGQLDYIVNNAGSQAWINRMKWDKMYQWRGASKKIFKLDQKTVGNYKNYDNLTYATIYNAGHLVPSDQPNVAYAMLEHFINNDVDWI